MKKLATWSIKPLKLPNIMNPFQSIYIYIPMIETVQTIQTRNPSNIVNHSTLPERSRNHPKALKLFEHSKASKLFTRPNTSSA